MRTYFILFSYFLTYSAYLAFPSHSQRYTASLGLNYSASLSRDQLSQLNPILLSRYSAFLTLSQPSSIFLSLLSRLTQPSLAFLSLSRPFAAILNPFQPF